MTAEQFNLAANYQRIHDAEEILSKVWFPGDEAGRKVDAANKLLSEASGILLDQIGDHDSKCPECGQFTKPIRCCDC